MLFRSSQCVFISCKFEGHAKHYSLIVLDLVWVSLWRSILRRKDFVFAEGVIVFLMAKNVDRGSRYELRENRKCSFLF